MDFLKDSIVTALAPNSTELSTFANFSTPTTLPGTTTTMLPPTTPTPEKKFPEYVGYICVAVAIIMYGSNTVPAKKFKTGDGVFFQFIGTMTIFITGLVLQMVQQSTFHTLAMLGGVIWAIGNMCVVPIFKTIGISMGLCIWGTCNLLAGWASERFGWFGLERKPLGHPALNYAGVALAATSAIIYSFIKPETRMPTMEITVTPDEEAREPLLNAAARSRVVSTNRPYYSEEPELIFSNSQNNPHLSFFDRMSDCKKKTVGISLSVFSGFLYGLNFAPPIYVMEHYEGASQWALDYVFAHYCGIFLTTSVIFVVYCMVMRNKPKVYPEAILPAVGYGFMWSIGTGCWFMANASLSESVSFPMICSGPGIIASIFWGIFVFKEIRGMRNILILMLALAFTVSGSTLAGLSLVGANNSTST